MSARGTPSRRSRAASSETCTVSDCRVPTTMLAMLSPLPSSRGLSRPTVQCPFNANVRADAAKYSPRAPAYKACPAAPSVSSSGAGIEIGQIGLMVIVPADLGPEYRRGEACPAHLRLTRRADVENGRRGG